MSYKIIEYAGDFPLEDHELWEEIYDSVGEAKAIVESLEINGDGMVMIVDDINEDEVFAVFTQDNSIEIPTLEWV